MPNFTPSSPRLEKEESMAEDFGAERRIRSLNKVNWKNYTHK